MHSLSSVLEIKWLNTYSLNYSQTYTGFKERYFIIIIKRPTVRALINRSFPWLFLGAVNNRITFYVSPPDNFGGLLEEVSPSVK